MNKMLVIALALLVIGASLGISGYFLSTYETTKQETYIETEAVSDNTYVKTVCYSYHDYNVGLASGQTMHITVQSDKPVGMIIVYKGEYTILDPFTSYSETFTDWGTYRFHFEIPVYLHHCATYGLRILITEEVEKTRTKTIRPYENLMVLSYMGVLVLACGMAGLFFARKKRSETSNV